MNRVKIKSLLIAGAVMVSMPATIASADAINGHHASTKVQATQSVNNDVNMGVAINSAKLTSKADGGSTVATVSQYDMLILHKQEGNSTFVTVKKTGETGYIQNSNIKVVENGTQDTLTKVNEEGSVIHVTTELNVRQGASVDTPVIGELTNGTALKVIGQEGQWYKIDFNGTQGFVYSLFTSVNGGQGVVSQNDNGNSTKAVEKSPSNVNTVKNDNSNNITKSVENNNTSNTANTVSNNTSNTGNTVSNNTSNAGNTVINNTGNKVKPSETTNNGGNTIKPEKPVKPGDNDNNNGNTVQKEAKLNVKVIDIQTGKPLANHEVVIGGSHMKTDAEGMVDAIPVWANEAQHISVTAEGFNTGYINFTPQANKTYTETVKIAPITANENVTVINGATKQPLKNTEVEIGGVQLKTNDKGVVKMENLWAGKQEFTLTTKGFKPAPFSFTAEAGKTGETTVTVTPDKGITPVQKEAKLNVKVIDIQTGKPLANHEVVIGGSHMKTNAAGMVKEIPVWANEAQHISVTAEGFNTGYINFTPKANKIYNETVKIAPITANENVTVINGATKQPLKNTEVEIGGVQLKTNDKGVVKMENLWAGKQEFTLTTKGFKAAPFSFTAEAGKTGETTVTVMPNKDVRPVQKEAKLNIKVIDVQTGAPLANHEVVIGGSHMKTNAEGMVKEIPVWANEAQHISVTANGFNTGYVNFTPKANKIYNETVKIAPITANENVTVINGATKQPLKNTEVEIGGVQLKTNDKGVVKMENLWAGKQEFTLTTKGFKAAPFSFTAEAGKTGETTVTVMPNKEVTPVQKQAKLNIKVIDVQTGAPLANHEVVIGGSHMKTNAEGMIKEIPVWANEAQHISVTANGFETGYINFTPQANKIYNETVKIAPITANENVTVVNKITKQPLKNTEVEIGGVQLKTNDNGVVKMENLWAGKQEFTLTTKGFNPAAFSFTAESGKTGETTVEVTPVQVQTKVNIKVMNVQTDAPLANHEVVIGGSHMKTNAEGIVEGIPVWANDAQHISVTANGFETGYVNFTPQANKIDTETVSIAPITANENVTVINKETKKPLKNTEVEIGGIHLKTNDNGVVKMENLWAGKQEFTLTTKGFKQASFSFTAEAGKTGETTVEVTPDAAAKPAVQASKVNITVINVQTGAPLANHEVVIGGAHFKTNAKGIVEGIPVWANEAQHISVTSNGFQTGYVNFTPEANKTYNETVKIAPIPANEIVTVVNKTTKKPLVDTEVNIGGINLKTNAKGQVTMSNLWAGKQEFTVTVKGFNKADFSFTAESGKTGETTVEVTPVQVQTYVNIKVMNFQTGAPLANHEVVIGGTHFKTNAEGIVEGIPVWAGDAQHITVTAAGFGTAAADFTPEANKTTTETVTIAPIPGNEIVTVINGADRKPVANTEVEIGGANLKTNAKGQVTMSNLWAGKQNFTLNAKGYNSADLTFNVESGKTGETTVIVTPKQQSTTFNIKVVDMSTGNPLKNTDVVISGAHFKTNAEGMVIGIPCWAGVAQHVTVSVKGFEESAVNFTPEMGKVSTETVKVAPIPGSATITFVNMSTGKPIANQWVSMGGSKRKTNDKGQITYRNMWAGTDTAVAKIDGFKDADVTFKVIANETTNTTVQVAPIPGSATIKFVDMSTGKPIANQWVTMGGVKEQTNAQGEVTYNNMWPGNDTSVAEIAGYLNANVAFKVEAGKTTMTTVKVAPQPGTAVLKFVDANTGKAIVNKKVTVGETVATTNAQGEITLANMWEGTDTVNAQVAGYTSKEVTFKVVKNKTTETVISMVPTKTTTIKNKVKSIVGK